MKKILCGALCAAVCATALVGCRSPEDQIREYLAEQFSSAIHEEFGTRSSGEGSPETGIASSSETKEEKTTAYEQMGMDSETEDVGQLVVDYMEKSMESHLSLLGQTI